MCFYANSKQNLLFTYRSNYPLRLLIKLLFRQAFEVITIQYEITTQQQLKNAI